jgi:hypothetical protein
MTVRAMRFVGGRLLSPAFPLVSRRRLVSSAMSIRCPLWPCKVVTATSQSNGTSRHLGRRRRAARRHHPTSPLSRLRAGTGYLPSTSGHADHPHGRDCESRYAMASLFHGANRGYRNVGPVAASSVPGRRAPGARIFAGPPGRSRLATARSGRFRPTPVAGSVR